MMEAFGAIATIVLAIIGLAGVLSLSMAAIATIIMGAAILTESGSLGTRWAFWRSPGYEHHLSAGEDMSAEFLGGLAGVVLGILALLGVSSQTLLSVAILVFGASFLLSGMIRSQTEVFGPTPGGHVLVGLAAVVLGILAVIGESSLTLVFVALLSLGAGGLFSGSAHSVRTMTEIHKSPAV